MTLLTREQLEEQLNHKSPAWWRNVQELIGKENFYYDKECKFGIVTIDAHAGVTPMHLACRRPGCYGVMTSAGYPPPESKPKWLGDATHEWYRPDSVDDDVDDPESEHVMSGGLLLRELKSADGE